MWYHRTINDTVRRVKIFGLRSDIEMAKYLYEMIGSAIFYETKDYKRAIDKRIFNGEIVRNPRQETTSFQVGMACRVNDRLIAMADALAPTAKTANGTSLVVVKDARVQEAFDGLNLKFRAALGGMSVKS